MGKLCECSNCDNCSHWATVHEITKENYEYAKQCLVALKRSFVCGQTNKIKPIGNKQQCKYFTDDMFHGKLENLYMRNIEEAEKQIAEYESTLLN